MIESVIPGYLTGTSLIVAIGAQNAYVLRQGLIRSHVAAVVLMCALSDLVLIVAGVGGVGSLVDHAAWVITLVRWLGVAFLVWYAAHSLRRAFRTSSLLAGESSAGESRTKVVARAAMLTWLNPHVYLDTVLLIGSVAAAHDAATGGRWWFGGGAAVASVVWFTALGFGARLLAPVLSRPRAWQVLEVFVAGTMLFVAATLALG